MVPEPEPTKEELLHEPTIGTVSPSTQKELRVPLIGERQEIKRSDGTTAIYIYNGTKWIYGGLKQNGILTTSPTQKQGGSMDLGTLTGGVIDIGLEALRSRVIKQPQAQPVGFFPAAAVGTAAGAVAGLAADAVDLFEEKKKKRRRRKRLATVSDIRDLAALKSILGNGDAFKTWIATHSR